MGFLRYFRLSVACALFIFVVSLHSQSILQLSDSHLLTNSTYSSSTTISCHTPWNFFNATSSQNYFLLSFTKILTHNNMQLNDIFSYLISFDTNNNNSYPYTYENIFQITNESKVGAGAYTMFLEYTVLNQNTSKILYTANFYSPILNNLTAFFEFNTETMKTNWIYISTQKISVLYVFVAYDDPLTYIVIYAYLQSLFQFKVTSDPSDNSSISGLSIHSIRGILTANEGFISDAYACASKTSTTYLILFAYSLDGSNYDAIATIRNENSTEVKTFFFVNRGITAGNQYSYDCQSFAINTDNIYVVVYRDTYLDYDRLWITFLDESGDHIMTDDVLVVAKAEQMYSNISSAELTVLRDIRIINGGSSIEYMMDIALVWSYSSADADSEIYAQLLQFSWHALSNSNIRFSYELQVINSPLLLYSSSSYAMEKVCVTSADNRIFAAWMSAGDELRFTLLAVENVTIMPSTDPTTAPTSDPTRVPSIDPTALPSSGTPTYDPTYVPTTFPPSRIPTHEPTYFPTTFLPSAVPTHEPTLVPTNLSVETVWMNNTLNNSYSSAITSSSEAFIKLHFVVWIIAGVLSIFSISLAAFKLKNETYGKVDDEPGQASRCNIYCNCAIFGPSDMFGLVLEIIDVVTDILYGSQLINREDDDISRMFGAICILIAIFGLFFFGIKVWFVIPKLYKDIDQVFEDWRIAHGYKGVVRKRMKQDILRNHYRWRKRGVWYMDLCVAGFEDFIQCAIVINVNIYSDSNQWTNMAVATLAVSGLALMWKVFGKMFGFWINGFDLKDISDESDEKCVNWIYIRNGFRWCSNGGCKKNSSTGYSFEGELSMKSGEIQLECLTMQ